jgi:hypothetical protein
MNQALYAHMNNKRKMKKKKQSSVCRWFGKKAGWAKRALLTS